MGAWGYKAFQNDGILDDLERWDYNKNDNIPKYIEMLMNEEDSYDCVIGALLVDMSINGLSKKLNCARLGGSTSSNPVFYTGGGPYVFVESLLERPQVDKIARAVNILKKNLGEYHSEADEVIKIALSRLSKYKESLKNNIVLGRLHDITQFATDSKEVYYIVRNKTGKVEVFKSNKLKEILKTNKFLNAKIGEGNRLVVTEIG